MSDNLQNSKFHTLSLPNEIGNVTVNDLMNHPDTEVIKRGNKLSLRRRSEHGVTTLEFSSYSSGRQEMKVSSTPRYELKKDHKDDIILMKKNGMPQKDIAFELGISESYVSNIIRQSR